MKKYIVLSLILHATVLLKLGNSLIQESAYAVSQGIGQIYMEIVPEVEIAQAAQIETRKISAVKVKSEFVKYKEKVIKKRTAKKKATTNKIVTKKVFDHPPINQNVINNSQASGSSDLARANLSNATSKASPDYLKNPPPLYPRKSRMNKEQGVALLLVDISADGKPIKLTLKKSSGFRRLDRSALKSVKDWKFKPARFAGIAVQSTVLVPVKYVLN